MARKSHIEVDRSIGETIASFFVLGGGFRDEFRALFIRDSRVAPVSVE
ncbi:hypothetical protein [Rhizobium sp. Root482]|nr:hypothetical protein [Rhizobium sp. Root482]